MRFRNILFFLGTVGASLMSVAAMASEVAAAAGSSGDLAKFGVAISLGIAAFGGALGQGKTAAAALEGIARNPTAQPKIFVPMIIALALIESLVIYALVMALMKV